MPKLPRELMELVRQRAANRCEYCLHPQAFETSTFHADHIRPRIAGGPTTPGNLCLACPPCSLRKSFKRKGRDPRSGLLVRLFHPRRDRWVEHFRLDRSGHIVGRTAIGRATIKALDLNDHHRVVIRVELLLMGRIILP